MFRSLVFFIVAVLSVPCADAVSAQPRHYTDTTRSSARTPSSEAKAEAKRLYKEGVKYGLAGLYAQAAQMFEQGRLAPDGKIHKHHPLGFVGRKPDELGDRDLLRPLGHEEGDVVVLLDGLARFGIAPYRQEREPLPQETHAIAGLGVEIVLGFELASPEALRELEAEYDAIVLGVGMGGDVDVSLAGADLPGVWDSLPFIEALKTGATPEVGDAVVVIGGGNTSIDVAREALRLGARDVTLLYRRSEAEMPAYQHEVEEARSEGVRFQWLTVPVRILGDGRVESVECRYVRLGEPDESGRRRPEPVEGTEFLVPADTVVKAIGQQPRAELLSWIEDLELEGGRLKVDAETGRTTNPKYFAAGDVLNGGATVVEAVRTAKIAARGIHGQLAGAA